MHQYLDVHGVALSKEYNEAFFELLRIYREFLHSVEFRKNDIYDCLLSGVNHMGEMEFEDWKARFQSLCIPQKDQFFKYIAERFERDEHTSQTALS